MDRARVDGAFDAVVPRLPHVDRSALIGRALTSWLVNRRESLPAATRAVVDTTWGLGYSAGVQDGHAAATWQLASTALSRATPAQDSLTGQVRHLAMWLHAARVDPQALADHLVDQGWRQVKTWQGAHYLPPDEPGRPWLTRSPILLAGPIDHEYPHQVLSAVRTSAVQLHESPFTIMARLSPDPAPAPAVADSQGLAALRHLYESAQGTAAAPSAVRDPGPSLVDHESAAGDLANILDPTEEGRLATAARAGAGGGYRAGFADATWAAGHATVTLAERIRPELMREVRVDNRPAIDWIASIADVVARVSEQVTIKNPPQNRWRFRPDGSDARAPAFPRLDLANRLAPLSHPAVSESARQLPLRSPTGVRR